MSFKQEISDKLNNLLQNSLDAVEGYKKAADKTDSPKLKAYFRTKVQERTSFAEELRTEVLRYGQIPEDSTSTKSTLHRAWIDIKTLFSGNDDEAVLEECIKGDEKALEDYQDLINQKDLPPTLDNIFAKHYQAIQNSLNKDRLYLQQTTTA